MKTIDKPQIGKNIYSIYLTKDLNPEYMKSATKVLTSNKTIAIQLLHKVKYTKSQQARDKVLNIIYQENTKTQ